MIEINKIHCMDCLEGMKQLEDNSIDTLISDPPYGLSFMGKKWDYDVPSIEIWKEALRVLKPGGTALIFAGSRTQHRMAVNVEDAGFILKDCIMWIYGSGFPKSLNIGKQIDKIGGKDISWFGKWLREFRIKNSLSQKEISKLFPSKTGGLTGCVANWELGLNIPTPEQFTKICKEFDLPFESLEQAEREIIGESKSKFFEKNLIFEKDLPGYGDFNLTTPATEEAKLWNGWGTALKPAYETILVAMKPNEGTYASNGLKWGVSGLNIDGCRIEFKNKEDEQESKGKNQHEKYPNSLMKNPANNGIYNKDNREPTNYQATGRFPANIILNEEAGKLLDEQSGMSKSSKLNGKGGFGCSAGKCLNDNGTHFVYNERGHNDKGGASRFFYCAKASKGERNKGCEELEEKQYSHDGREKPIENAYQRNNSKATNFHPTVKPLKLMEYLCKLTKTPTGGIVLDPFSGSGTTGLACLRTNRKFIGFELSEEYCEIANKRLEHQKNIEKENLGEWNNDK